MLKKFDHLIAGIRHAIPKIGWKWAVADALLKHLGVNEATFFAGGLASPVRFRPCTSDIFEMMRLLGPHQTPLNLPFRPSVIVDAGANAGYSALRFQKEFPGATIIAVEPESTNVSILRKNCGPYPNITVEDAAIWPISTRLGIKRMDVGPNAYQIEEQKSGSIRAISIDDVINKYALPLIDLLKIDIEGSELALFSHPSARSWLPRVRMILIELHDDFAPGCSLAVDRATAGLFNHTNQKIDEYTFLVSKTK